MADDRELQHTVDVFELARTGGDVAGELPIREAGRLAPMLARTEGVLRYRAWFGTDEHGRPSARFLWSATLAARCDRCGAPVEVDVGADARFYFVRTEEELNALPIEPDEAEEPLVGSRSFDLDALVEDEAILSLPLAPRHSRCGDDADLEGGADQRSARTPAFAALARLRSGKR
jgi:uncharacterized protein